MYEHLQSQHPRTYKCSYCMVDMHVSELSGHLRTCPFSTKPLLEDEDSVVNLPNCNFNVENFSADPPAEDRAIPDTENLRIASAISSSTDANSESSNSDVAVFDRDDLIIFKVTDITFRTPLAIQMRPKVLNQMIGQSALATGSYLRTMLSTNVIPNMIIQGPPGCGKTSLGRVIRGICRKDPDKWTFVNLTLPKSSFEYINSVINSADQNGSDGITTLLFMDRIERFSNVQERLLPSIAKGDIVVVGTTTHQPSLVVVQSLYALCQLVSFDALCRDDLFTILECATDSLDFAILNDKNIEGYKLDPKAKAIERSALEYVACLGDEDARICLNTLQLILEEFNVNHLKFITLHFVMNTLAKSYNDIRPFTEKPDLMSILHKSICLSNENASVYWMARMLQNGFNPKLIAERFIQIASADIGNADHYALPLAISTMQACLLLKAPDVVLTQCVIYLARACKCKEAHRALQRAKNLIARNTDELQPEPPSYIKYMPKWELFGYGALETGEEDSLMPDQYHGVLFCDHTDRQAKITSHMPPPYRYHYRKRNKTKQS